MKRVIKINKSVLAALQLNYGLTPIPLVGKKPILKDWPNRFINDPIQQKEINEGIIDSTGKIIKFDDKNIGVITGAVSDCIVLDIDNLSSLSKLEKMGDIPLTWKVRTNRGIHLYFNNNDQIQSMKLWDNIDILSDKKQVVAPPSIHPNGTAYRWDLSPKQVEKAELPKWLVQYLSSNQNFKIHEQASDKKTNSVPVYRNKTKLKSSEIDKLIEQVDWIEFYSKITTNIRGRGVWRNARCPFHQEKHNSFSFNTNNGAWTCFAGCGSGSSINIIRQIYGLTVKEAFRLIKGENIYVK